MKNHTNGILVVLLIMGFVSLGIGHSANLPQHNRNNFDRHTSNKNSAPPVCIEVTASDILKQINYSPESLRRQFRDETITYSFTGQELIFKGYIHGNGNNLRSLLGGFDKLRGAQCLRVISFEGNTDGSNFEWRADPDLPSSASPDSCDVSGVIEKVLEKQLNNTFFYTYDKTTGILKFSGHIGDAPGKGRFNSLIAQLQRFMKNGCIKKIIFAKGAKESKSSRLQSLIGNGCPAKAAFTITKIAFVPETGIMERLLLNRGFEWQVCEYPSCECAGECRPCSDPC